MITQIHKEGLEIYHWFSLNKTNEFLFLQRELIWDVVLVRCILNL